MANAGVVAFDPETHIYRFLYRTNNNRWQVNHVIPDRIRNGALRFYGFGDLFALVDDTGHVLRYSPLWDNELQVTVADPAIGGQGVTWDYIRPLGPIGDPGEQDRIFREDRDRRLAFAAPPGGQPPPPPGGGAVAAAGAESQPRDRPQRQEAAVAALAVAALAGEPAARPRRVGIWELLDAAAAAAAPQEEEQPPRDWANRVYSLPAPAEDLSDDARLLLDAVRASIARRPPPVRTDWTIGGAIGTGAAAAAGAGAMGRGGRGADWLTIDPWEIGNIAYSNLYAPRAAARPTGFGPAATDLKPPLPHVAEAVLERAVRNKETCPISLEELSLDTGACVAPCYHAFQKEAIQEWMREHTTCPQCRQACCL